jgi:hypothetical protein
MKSYVFNFFHYFFSVFLTNPFRITLCFILVSKVFFSGVGKSSLFICILLLPDIFIYDFFPDFSIEIVLVTSFKLVSISFGLFKALFVKEIVFLDEFLLEFLVLNANYFCYPAKYPPRNQISD